MKLKLSRGRSKKRSTRGEVVTSPEALLVKELTATFAVFDRDAKGRISKSELSTVLSSLGDDLNDAELDELMAKVDDDGDGFIDLHEFITFHTEKSPRASDASQASSAGGDSVEWSEATDALQAAFDVFDVNKDGYISAEELRRVMCSLGDKHTSLADCRHMINCVDKNGDHKVDFTEFRCLMSGPILC